ncbi:solute carrier family 5 (high affinity choline transporter), member 7 [Mytilus galloprovincialis]|uniref:Solute carrier family 5 (High affinity choline transporter), member 7 n=1 Tax=Mytilus galloprovincialis TaxID=29158 RepID=A0A8B6DK32_MYTGA|nr:solute carrier family 5 (high affinity choline transporter), member 7 [Mytilus galloprovincialis]
MAIHIPGLIGIIVFYLLILAIGIIAGRKKNKKGDSDEMLVAGRNLGFFVAVMTNTATMVGGAYINGTAEVMGRDGLVWCFAPVGFCIGIIIAALFYAPKAREKKYTTIFDLLQEKYGKRIGGLLFINELLADVFWESAILSALGSTLHIILGIDMSTAVIVSACVAVFYTFFGGLYSVAYTDVAQLFLISIGLLLIIPFAWTNPAVDMSRIKDNWKGSLEPKFTGVYIDMWLITIGGCFTWQAFYQRVLACKTTRMARDAVLVSSFLALLMGVPPALAGVIGAATDWNQTMYNGNPELSTEEWSYVLPMVLAYLCPMAVSVFGLGAISAAVMSSADSIVLATGSVISHNLYKNCFRPKATQRELTWVLRVSIFLTGILGTVIAIAVKSVYGLFILCVDIMYVIQMPELTCALWFEKANGYGSLVGFVVGLLLRILGGEPILSFPAVIKYPWYDPVDGQLFPHKTFAMLVCVITIIGVSLLTDYVFTNNKIDKKFDIFNCFQEKMIEGKEESHRNAVELKSDEVFDEKQEESEAFFKT